MRGTDMEHFRTAMRDAGLQPPEVIEPDGKLHRFSTNGNARDTAGWYVFYSDGIPAGAFGDWRAGRSESWHAEIGRPLNTTEDAAHRARMAAARRLRDEDRARTRADAAIHASTLWASAHDAPLDHPYLVRKQVQPHGAREHDRALVLPVIVDGHICSLQFIHADGSKRFLNGGRVKGGYFGLGNFETPGAVIISLRGSPRAPPYTKQRRHPWRWRSLRTTLVPSPRRFGRRTPTPPSSSVRTMMPRHPATQA